MYNMIQIHQGVTKDAIRACKVTPPIMLESWAEIATPVAPVGVPALNPSILT
jgi:hypothetical protein